MSYTDTIICIEPDQLLETWPPIYRGQERPAGDKLRLSEVRHHVYSRYMPRLTDLYLRVHLTPYSPDPKSFILDICQVNPCHLGSLKLGCPIVLVDGGDDGVDFPLSAVTKQHDLPSREE
jgi:hypothetical protein